MQMKQTDIQIVNEGEVLSISSQINEELREYWKNRALMLEGMILDIKKEIQCLPNANPSYWNQCDVVDREEALDIIDKHIEEFISKEGD